MLNDKSVMGIIPARGGSKRIARKNMALLAGKPLLAYTLEAGLNSKYIDTLVLSTDDPEMASLGRNCGASVPFVRPAKLAEDSSKTIDVVRHAIEYYRDMANRSYDYIVLLQPTSPLRLCEDIDSALEYLMEKKAGAVISVCKAEHNPHWANQLPLDYSLVGFIKDDTANGAKVYYRLNGSIYICDTQRLLTENTFFLKSNIFAYIMPRETSVDIDDFFDLELCEYLLQRIRQ